MKKLAGVYLVLDPSREWALILSKLASGLSGGINIVQIWNHWNPTISYNQKLDFLKKVNDLCAEFEVPVLMNEDYELALNANLSGVHFDEVPADIDVLKNKLADKTLGLTVGNDTAKIKLAKAHGFSYISFCSVFPSSSVDTCDLVSTESIRAAKSIADIPVFLSGGITVESLHKLKGLDFDGVAVISGLLDAVDPGKAVKLYLDELDRIKE